MSMALSVASTLGGSLASLKYPAARRIGNCPTSRFLATKYSGLLWGAPLGRGGRALLGARLPTGSVNGGVITAHLDPHFALSVVPAGVHEVVEHAQNLLYTVAADEAVQAVTDAVTDTAVQTVQKDDGGIFAVFTQTLEGMLKVLDQGLTALHVPYSYGFAIILLTLLVKLVTYPLTKKQVESTMAMQNLQPKIKAIQERYKGDQERVQLETSRLYKQAGVNPLAGCLPTLATIPVFIGLYRALSNVANEGLLTDGFFWIPSLAGPTTLAARGGGSGVAWLFPFVDGQPPLGWGDTAAYLVLPVLLVASQFVSMQMMTPPNTDPSQQQTQAILKFLPLMIGYFSLSVPSGLSLYWLTNNILSTGQQVLLKKMGAAQPAVGAEPDILSAGLAKRSSAASTAIIDVTPEQPSGPKPGERFRQLKEEEAKKRAARREASLKAQAEREAEKVKSRAEAEVKAQAQAEAKAAAEAAKVEAKAAAEVAQAEAKAQAAAQAAQAQQEAGGEEEEEEGDDEESQEDEWENGVGASVPDGAPGRAGASNGSASKTPVPSKRSRRSKRKRAASA